MQAPVRGRPRRARLLLPALAGLALALLAPGEAPGQAIPFSQRGTVTQRVAFTEISVDSNRPVARGRTIFGGLLPWDRIWHPGADSATRISFSRDVVLEGHPVAAGRYSLWTIPRENGRWTIILSRAADVFHTPYPGEADDALRFEVQTERGAHMETLAFYFPVVDRDRAVLRLHWAETMVPLEIRAPAGPGG